MNTTVPQLARTLQTLFTTDAEQAATDARFIRRRRCLSGAAFAQGLVFTWLDNPDATLDELAVGLAAVGAPLKPQSLDARFTPAAAEALRRLLERALQYVVAAEPSAVPLLRRFPGVYLLDGSIVTLPAALAELWPGCGRRPKDGSGQAALKLMVRYELNRGMLEGLTLHAGRHADARTDLHSRPLPVGALRLADLGFFDVDVLQAYDQQGVYFVSRPQPGTIIYDGSGRPWKLARFLASRHGDRVDDWVQLGRDQRLACRLLAVRTPPEVAKQRQVQARERAQRHGRELSLDGAELCGWTVFVSNAPVWLLSLGEAWALYRARWQIELLFKLWKSDGHLDASRSAQPYRVLCEVYAKLLGMVVQHWLLLSSDGAAFSGKSLRKAARAVRKQVTQLVAVLGRTRELRRALRGLRLLVAAAGGVPRRRRRSTYQTLMNPRHDGLT